MGIRFRKSLKLAPGVKLNLNKKSTSVTFGGKGVHYTVSSTGKHTKSFGIPGSGIYYTETTSKKQNSPALSMSKQGTGIDKNKKKHGCLFYLLAFLAICTAIAIYSLMWIPAIGFIVYFAIKNDIYGTKKRNLGISSSIFITSLIIFLMMGCSATDSITSIQADWQKNTFDISETTEVEITVLPSDADIDSLQLSENNIAKLNYTDGKSIITFTKTGQASLFFTANDDIDSNVVKITVLDKAEEEAKLKAEEEARLKAEEEARLKAEEEARLKAEQEAQAAAIAAEQERIAQEQAAAQAATQQAVAATVWLSATGSKYHSIPDCGNMNPNNAWQVSLTDAQSMGYEACKKCH